MFLNASESFPQENVIPNIRSEHFNIPVAFRCSVADIAEILRGIIACCAQ